MPRMLDEVLAITGDLAVMYGRGSAMLVMCDDYTRSSYYGLADYYVSSVIGTGAVVMCPTPKEG